MNDVFESFFYNGTLDLSSTLSACMVQNESVSSHEFSDIRSNDYVSELMFLWSCVGFSRKTGNVPNARLQRRGLLAMTLRQGAPLEDRQLLSQCFWESFLGLPQSVPYSSLVCNRSYLICRKAELEPIIISFNTDSENSEFPSRRM